MEIPLVVDVIKENMANCRLHVEGAQILMKAQRNSASRLNIRNSLNSENILQRVTYNIEEENSSDISLELY